MATQIPPGAPRSEDGYYWWDQDGNEGEGQWRPVNQPDAGTGTGSGTATGTGTGTGTGAQATPQQGQQSSQQAQQSSQQPQSVQLDLNDYPALWRLSQVYPNNDGVTQYLSQLGINVDAVDWELHQRDRDAFYSAVLVAADAIYRVVAQALSDTSDIAARSVTAAAEAMTRVVAAGTPIRDFLYSADHGTESDSLRQELDELQFEAGLLT